MVDAYVRERMRGTAVFELYFRELPETRNFAIAAGLQRLLEALENLTFSDEVLEYLRGRATFSAALLDYLRAFRFSGDVDALPEGTVVFPYEPLVRVTAPLPEAQLIETLRHEPVVRPLLPRIAPDGRTLLPGEPGYDALG